MRGAELPQPTPLKSSSLAGVRPQARKLWNGRAKPKSAAGEILLTAMDRDGTGLGFDCELTSAVASSVSIPVIASGGAGNAEHFVEVFSDGRADAALAASIFHFGTHAVADLKLTLLDAGIPMRWPC